MGIVKNWKGSWGTPDFGVTEWLGDKLGKSRDTSTGGSQLFGTPYTANLASTGGANPYSGSVVQNVTSSQSNPQTQGFAAPTGGGAPQQTHNPQQYIDQTNQQTQDYNSIIDQDYNDAINYIGQQETYLRGDAGTAQSEIKTGFQGAVGNLASAQASGQAGIQDQINVGQTSADTGMREARDLYRQQQQTNIAQLSALGLSSSSVNEALSERLGIATARRVASISNNLADIKQGASKELSRVNEYYSTQKSTLEQTMNTEISKIQNSLLKGITQLNYSRTTAASEKAKQRYGLLSAAQEQTNAIRQQAQEFEESLRRWQVQKTSSLNPLITDPNFLAQYNRNIQGLNAQPGITNTQLGNYGISPTGQQGFYSGQLKSQKKDDDEVVGGVRDLTSPSAWPKY